MAMLSALAGALSGGLQGWMRGSEFDEQIRRANEAKVEREQAVRRQMEQDAFLRKLSEQQMANANADLGRRMHEGGFSRVPEPVQQAGEQMARMQPLPGPVGGIADFLSGLSRQAKATGGWGKTMPSAAERAAQAAAYERGQDREYAEGRDAQNFEQQKELARLQANLRPREPRPPNLIPGNDGQMYEYRNGQMVPVPVAGGQPPMGGDQPQGVPVPSGMGRASGAGPGGGGMGPFGKAQGSERPLTEGERRAGAFLTVAENAYNTLESIVKDKKAPRLADQIKQKMGRDIGNVLTSDDQRRMTNAALQLSDMWLRYTSGAAVPEQEVERFAQGFIPRAGDDETTLQQKKAGRDRIIQALRVAGGRATEGNGPQEDARDESAEDARFRARMREEGYSDDEIDYRLAQRRGGGR